MQAGLLTTYVCNTKERYEKGGDDDEEGEELSVLVEEFKLINQPRDHRLHPTHLRQQREQSERIDSEKG